jgi:hypothetical protein
MFRALDDADDVANLNSLELTFAWFNECRDIHPDIVDAMSKRVGRFPSPRTAGRRGMACGATPTRRPWTRGGTTRWRGWTQGRRLAQRQRVGCVQAAQSGRSPYAENIENLPDGYYDTQGRSEEYIRVYIDGEYGLSSRDAGLQVLPAGLPHGSGEAALHRERRAAHHGRHGLGPYSRRSTGTARPRGRALILDEAVSFDMGVQRFVRTMLKPLLYERFPGAPVLVVTDPAGCSGRRPTSAARWTSSRPRGCGLSRRGPTPSRHGSTRSMSTSCGRWTVTRRSWSIRAARSSKRP